MGAINALCNRGLLLVKGVLGVDSTSDKAIETYLDQSAGQLSSDGEVTWSGTEAPGGDEFRLRAIRITSVKKNRIQALFSPSEAIDVQINYQVETPIQGMRLVLQVIKNPGEIAFTSTDHPVRKDDLQLPGKYCSKCRIPGNLLNSGSYTIRIWGGIPEVKYLVDPRDYLTFVIEGVGSHGASLQEFNKWPGVVNPILDWEIEEKTKDGN